MFVCMQVLPLVPPGRKGNEDGSPYAGQVKSFKIKIVKGMSLLIWKVLSVGCF